MNDDQILEKILNRLLEANGGAVYVCEFLKKELELDRNSCTEYVDRLESLGLARGLDPKQRMVITDHGRQIIKNGGWLKYLNQKVSEKFKADERQSLETELTVSNIEANRLNKRNSKYNIWFSVINIIIGLLNLWLILKAVK